MMLMYIKCSLSLFPSVPSKDPLKMKGSVKSNKALEKTMPTGERRTQGLPQDLVRISALSPLLQFSVMCLPSSKSE